MGQITDNAIAWVQFRNAGGFKISTLVGVAYAAIVIAIGALILMVNAGQSRSLDGMPSVLLGFQAIIAGGFVLLRILNAVQRDTQGKLLESHRLMPIDPRLAVLGYAAGGGAPVLPIVLVNLLLGGIAAGHAGLPMNWWFWANGVLLSWCMFAWCVAAGGGMLGIGIGVLVLGPIVGTFMTAGALTMLVPGLGPMVSPLMGKTIFAAQNVGSEELVRWVICMALQLPVAWVIVLAGARRFRLGDIPGFTGILGSVLVLVLALASIVAVLDPAMLPRHMQRGSSDTARNVGTLIALMLLGSFTAMWHVNRHAAEFQGKYRGRSLLIRDAGIVLTVVVGAVAFLSVVPDLPADWPRRIIWTATELVIVMTTTLMWARWAVRRASPAAVCLSVIGAWWVLPLMAGVMLDTKNAWESTSARTAMQISPMAMLPAIWDNRSGLAQVSSLAMQLAVPALGAILLLKGVRVEESLGVAAQAPALATTSDQIRSLPAAAGAKE